MDDLIELTGAELAVADRGIEISLYELAKKYNKDHSKMVRQFESDVESLSVGSRATLQFGEKVQKIKTGSGAKDRTISTYTVNVKTAVWFSARFDAELRAQVVNYAFEKLEQEHNQDVKQLSTKVSKIQTKLNYHKDKKLNSYNGWESASKLITKHDLTLTPTELLNALEEAGMVQSTIVERVVREPMGQYANKTEKGTLIFSENRILEMIETGEL